MAGPISSFTIVAGSASLALRCASVSKSLYDLATKYKRINLTILSVVQSLDTIQVAWSRIGKRSLPYSQQSDCWIEDVEDHINDSGFLQRLERSLEVG